MSVFKLLSKYRPEDKAAKKERLQQLAQTKASGGKEDAGKKPTVVKYGINHITALVEQKKAKLVVIAHDVDPIEIVVWLPALCQKFEVPYAIVKGKARLGKVVNKKTATAVALVDVKAEVRPTLVRPPRPKPERCAVALNPQPSASFWDWRGHVLVVVPLHCLPAALSEPCTGQGRAHQGDRGRQGVVQRPCWRDPQEVGRQHHGPQVQPQIQREGEGNRPGGGQA